MRNFNDWLSKFKESVADYKYYVDFDKVYKEVEKIKVELNIMNSLIGSKNIEKDFEKLLKDYPQILKCIPILLAKREKEIIAIDEEGTYNFNFNKMNYTVDEYKMFMRKTGLFELISNRLVNNLVDYVLGVESGLNSNGRKNRGGHLMENILEGYLKKSNLTYFKEMYLKDIESKWGLDLASISNAGKSAKRFDFVVKTESCIYAIECNFYSSNGSKLNETARSYKMIALESKNISGFKFVWFTDGIGWKSARKNLEETFDVLEDLYSIDDLENDIILKKIK
ncbi:MAG: type II restriction endonuclease [Bacilli bacterium]|nr:type II restriction endonuclease [Bacilli bacterium]